MVRSPAQAPRFWRKPYWIYLTLSQYLSVCVTRHAIATQTGDLATIKAELENTIQIAQATKAALTLAEQQDTYPQNGNNPSDQAYESVVISPIIEVQRPQHRSQSTYETDTYQPDYSRVYIQSNSAIAQSNPYWEPYPKAIRWFGHLCKFLLWSIAGAVMAGCLAFITGQIQFLSLFMLRYSQLFWRLTMVIFAIGILIVVYFSTHESQS